ncbi:MAG: extracellular solute-binding protein [Chloroflexi bacterium]|nr:extracellular solute-binding protein [Chloroflexota bacterium]
MKKGSIVRATAISAVLIVVLAGLFVGCKSSGPTTSTSSSTVSSAKPSSSSPVASSTTTSSAKPSATTTAKPSATTTTQNRQEQLEAAAKKEAKVVLWSPAANVADQFLGGFYKKYPDIKVETWNAEPAVLTEKALTEAKAGRYSVDIVLMGEGTIKPLGDANLLDKYDWPNTANWPKETKDGTGGLYVRTSAIFFAPVYNTKLVTGKDIPTSWDDLQNPKWKGKAVASITSYDMPLLTAALWGTGGKLDWDKSFAYWKKVFDNTQPTAATAYTAPTNMLATGEYSLFLANSGAITLRAIANGQPIAMAKVDYPARTYAFTLMKNAPHPNAAKLLADYLTSKEGSIAWANANAGPSFSPDAGDSMPNKAVRDAGATIKMIPLDLLTDENMKKAGDFWRASLGVK